MGRGRLQVTNGTVESIESQLRKDERFSQGVRLYAVLLVAKGKKPQELEDLYNTSHKSITNWVHRYNKGGVEALKDRPRPGRPPKITSEQKLRLRDIVLNQSPEQYGFNSGTWSGPMIKAILESEFKVSYKKAQVYNLLHSLGLTHQKGRAKYPEADTEENLKKREDLKKNFKILNRTR